ncbi:MAG: hypothetical protein JRJ77_11270 [Deltaproteobacteria bacterium]|nr:hypothetical protein [Deltaproteobacteria bacterium]
MKGRTKNAELQAIEVIPGLVTLISPVRRIYHLTFGEQLPKASQTGNTPITIRYEIHNKLSPPNEDLHCLSSYFFGSPGYDGLYYSRVLFKPFKLELQMEGLATEQPAIRVNKLYTKTPFRLNNIFPSGAHITDIITIHLLLKKWVPLSAACIEIGGKATLLIAPPDTGKTLTVMQGLKQNLPFNYMAEDICVTNADEVIGCPWTISFRHQGYLGSPWEKFLAKLHARSPAFNLLTKRFPGHLDRFFNSESYTPHANIERIIALQRTNKGKTAVRRLKADEIEHLIIQLNRYEFTYYRNPLLRAYAYFNPDILSLENFQNKEETILQKLSHKYPAYQIVAADPNEFLRCMKELVFP